MARSRIHVVTLAGVCCVFALWVSPGRSQDATPAPTKSPAAKTADAPAPTSVAVIPKKTITTKDPTIPPEELALLVRPLTLEQLKVEADAWMTLLQKKAVEISNAEVAIRRQTLSVGKQKEATDAIEKAKNALAEAEKSQSSAKQGTPEYEQATKKVEQAKDELKKSQAAVQEAAQSKKDLKQVAGLQSALKEAKKEGELDNA